MSEIADRMSERIVKLDVREDIARGREPLGKILQTVSRLKKNEQLLLIAPFQPVPLFQVLGNRGFSHQAKETPGGAWEVLFTRESEGSGPQNTPVTECGCHCVQGKEYVEVDARGLEPPQPMVRILEALQDLEPDMGIKAHTDRRPIHLYAHLDERGFVGESEEQGDGSFLTYIRRKQ